MDVYLIRHTTPDIPKGVCYGQLDIDVTASFDEELERLRRVLPGGEEWVCYASPLQRCARLARALCGDQVRYDERLKELDFGEWEGLPWSAIDAEVLSSWMDDFTELPTPGGESYRALYRRCEAFWEEMLEREHTRVMIVAHGGVIRSLIIRILEMPLHNLYRFALDFGGVSLLRVQESKETVISLNR